MDVLAGLVLGIGATLGGLYMWYHRPSDPGKAARERADEALRKKQESAERYERMKWRNWMAW